MSGILNRNLTALLRTVLCLPVLMGTGFLLDTPQAKADPLVRLQTEFGDIIINMTPEVAPATVDNFLTYVNSGAFNDSIFHRNPTPQGTFVLQGGDAFFPSGSTNFSFIPDNPPVVNEFNVSNTRGTVAMAKAAGNPNSATNNFFVNLADNGANLDVQNEGFTVFGTISETGMAVVDQIAALPVTSVVGLGDTVPVTTNTVPFSRGTSALITTAQVLDRVSPLAAAILPASRSVSVGVPATGFATIINTSTTDAVSCSMQPVTEVDADFFYRRTNPASNQPFGVNNPALDLAGGEAVSLLFTFTPTASFANTNIEFGFDCDNASAAAGLVIGVNTFDLVASTTPIADVVALSGTTTSDGITNINLNDDETIASGAFVVATANVGAAETITVTADTGSTSLPIALFICPTDAETGFCLEGQPPAESVTVAMSSDETDTFAVFAQQANVSDTISFDPANNRAFVRFRNGSGELRGGTSVALRSSP